MRRSTLLIAAGIGLVLVVALREPENRYWVPSVQMQTNDNSSDNLLRPSVKSLPSIRQKLPDFDG